MTPLHLFPTAGFDRSTTTPVLLGVLVSWFFAETFGWVFAGLVVPGYLAAVFAIDPRAGMVDVAEAIFTYGLARGLGEHLPRTGLTSRVFGRERFLLIVLCSIVVRLAVEGAILPRLAPHAAGHFFSIGLVVVPLAANACWKTGLGKGLVQNGVPTLIVFLLLKFVFLPYTNLSLAGFELATEDVASSFLASPKAYILLITGAILAAAANVLDGWDFNGILIPALLALVVVEPVKFGATFVETLAIVAIATALLKTTPLGRTNVEGPRRLVLLFSIDYALRFAFALVVGGVLPGGDVVGLMGFGYLLPTLLAVKITQRGSAPLILLPTAQVGVSAFALGTLIGFSAAVVDTSTSAARPQVTRALPRAPEEPEAAALWLSGLARTTPHEGKGPSPLSATDLAAAVESALGSGGATTGDAEKALGPLTSQALAHGVVLLRERFERLEDRWGDPAILVTPSHRASGRRVVALVSSPATDPEAAALAGRLVREGRVDAAVVAGVDEGAGGPFASAAKDAARALAARDAEPGVVLALAHTDEKSARIVLGPRAASAARVDATILALEAKVGPMLRRTGDPGDGVDARIEIPTEGLVALLEGAASSPVSIASPAAAATVLDAVKVSDVAHSPEDLLALRRLLLEPLVGPNAPRSIPLLRARAAALGYELHGPSPLGDGTDALVLLPGPASRPIAIVARTHGVKGTVIEVPHGFRDGLRDVALRLASTVSADAVIFGLEHGGGARGGAAMRLAHAVATAPAAERKSGVVVLREAPEGSGTAGVVALGTWGGPAKHDLRTTVEKAFVGIGLATEDRPLDLAVREMSGRAVFGEVPVVSATVDATALRAISLDDARSTARVLASSGLPALEGSVPAIAEKLAASITTDAVDHEPPRIDVVELARRATVEHSIVARRTLAATISSTATRAALVRSKTGDFVVVVARVHEPHEKAGKHAWLAAAVSTDPRAPRAPLPPLHVKSLRDCAAALDAGGLCRAEVP